MGDTATTLTIVGAVVVTGAVLAWFWTGKRHPERAADHHDTAATAATTTTSTTTDRLDGGVDRPAGPEAETMAPERLGGDERPPSP